MRERKKGREEDIGEKEVKRKTQEGRGREYREERERKEKEEKGLEWRRRAVRCLSCLH